MPGGAAGAGGWCCEIGRGQRKFKEDGEKAKRQGLEEVQRERRKEGKGRINSCGLLSTASHCAKCFANLISVCTIGL